MDYRQKKKSNLPGFLGLAVIFPIVGALLRYIYLVPQDFFSNIWMGGLLGIFFGDYTVAIQLRAS